MGGDTDESAELLVAVNICFACLQPCLWRYFVPLLACSGTLQDSSAPGEVAQWHPRSFSSATGDTIASRELIDATGAWTDGLPLSN